MRVIAVAFCLLLLVSCKENNVIPSHTDSLEEIHENKEQIEISRAYERMPNPSLLATQEFVEDKIYFRKGEDQLFD